MKNILLFGAGKSATCLIDYLVKEVAINDWTLVVCDANLALVQSKLQGAQAATPVSIDVENEADRGALIRKADIVLSLLPASLHYLVAKDCVLYGKHLLNASYIDNQIRHLEEEIKKKNLLFLCEMGLDPGIDHMSAMHIIESIKMKGGIIQSFKSHCGGLVAPESDDNPWHYKVSWNPRNIVTAGCEGAEYLLDKRETKVPYTSVFRNAPAINIPGIYPLAWYPNRNSMHYIDLYSLAGIQTFVRTTLRHPSFCRGWSKLVNIGFTQTGDFEKIKECKTFKDWFNVKIARYTAVEKDWNGYLHLYITDPHKDEFAKQIAYLKLESKDTLPPGFTCSADILQFLIENKLRLTDTDKDMIIMLHELEYVMGDKKYSSKSTLIVKGDDNARTAMAKTVGLPLGIAARLLLQNKLTVRGLHIPIIQEIYGQILPALEEYGIRFEELVQDVKEN